MEYVVVVVMLALLQYTWFGIEVGRARGRFEVPAPATTGMKALSAFFARTKTPPSNWWCFCRQFLLALTQ